MLFPVAGEFDRKYIPWVTICLICISILVFFTVQLHDSRQWGDAMEFYLDTELVWIEYAYYQKFSQDLSLEEAFQRVEEADSERPPAEAVGKMLRNGRFREAMRSGDLIGPGDPKYEKWRDLSRLFERKRHRVSTYSYGLIPNQPGRIWTWLTHIFLHGGLGHLLGNMLFLWLAGYILEGGAGHARFAGTYAVGGVAAAILFWALNSHLATPLVGASGAISGVMGALTLTYGLHRIKVFLNLGFFFHYFSMPAVLLLPVWLGKEGYHLLVNPESSVAFTAHIGGLLGGAMMGWLNRSLLGFDPGRLSTGEKDRVGPLLEEAMAAIRETDFSRARRRLQQVLDIEPGNSNALKQLFILRAQDPSDHEISELANRMLRALLEEGASEDEVERIYREHCSGDQRVVLEPALALRLASLFLRRDRAGLGEPLLARALKSSVPLQDAPAVLYRYGSHYRDKGEGKKSRACFAALKRLFPESLEAQSVRQAHQEEGTEWER